MGPAQLAAPVCLSFVRCLASAVAGQEQLCSTSLSNKAKDAHLRQPARCIQSALERLTSPPAVDNDIAEVVAARWHAERVISYSTETIRPESERQPGIKGRLFIFGEVSQGCCFFSSVAILFTSVPKSGVHGTLHITIPPPPTPPLFLFFYFYFAHIKQDWNLQTRGIVFITGGGRGFSINQRVDSDVSALHVVGFLVSKMFVMRSEACCCFY